MAHGAWRALAETVRKCDPRARESKDIICANSRSIGGAGREHPAPPPQPADEIEVLRDCRLSAEQGRCHRRVVVEPEPHAPCEIELAPARRIQDPNAADWRPSDPKNATKYAARYESTPRTSYSPLE